MRSFAVNGKRSKMIERREMATSYQLTTLQLCKNLRWFKICGLRTRHINLWSKINKTT